METLTFSTGMGTGSQLCFNLNIINDGTVEFNEVFEIDISVSEAALQPRISVMSRANIVILDDDGEWKPSII